METINIDNLSISIDKEQYIEKCIQKNWLNIQFEYSSDFKNTKKLRNFIEIIFEKFQISQKYIARFIIATDEMNNNAIEYGSLSHENNYLRVDIKRNWKKLSVSIEVEDSWNGKFAKTAEEMEEFRKTRVNENYHDHRSIRWRGLFLIIIKIVDKLYFQNTKNGWLIVGFKKDLLNI